jgi:tetratricopeptide (TPR) repeat protein
MLQEFAARIPNYIPALLRLIEICVDGGLEASMQDAQANLADAYLNAGQATEARVISEDLVAREPWERAHIDRFRRALVMLKVSEPDTVIAERLSGQAPFMATDPFADYVPPSSAPAENPAGPAPTEKPRLDVGAGTESSSAGSEGPEAAAPAETPAPKRKKKAAKGVEIDLSNALDHPEETAPTQEDDVPPEERLEEAFKDFRSEVSRQTGVDKSAQHMTLARTYIEMGMPDDAIASLKTASRSPSFRFDAASTLGRIYRDKGDDAQAVEWLERAAEAPAPTVDDGRALLYDLGSLVEQSGDTARALAIFLELQSEAGDYRDVAERVERLTRVEAGG